MGNICNPVTKGYLSKLKICGDKEKLALQVSLYRSEAKVWASNACSKWKIASRRGIPGGVSYASCCVVITIYMNEFNI